MYNEKKYMKTLSLSLCFVSPYRQSSATTISIYFQLYTV